MELLTILNKLEPYMERITRHYKQRNTDALIYTNTNNKSITINSEDIYNNPQAILVYNTSDHIEIAVQIYNTMHTYNTEEISALVVAWKKKMFIVAALTEAIVKRTKANVVICYLLSNAT